MYFEMGVPVLDVSTVALIVRDWDRSATGEPSNAQKIKTAGGEDFFIIDNFLDESMVRFLRISTEPCWRTIADLRPG